MDCGKIRALLAACHDGELAPADRARVDEHLRGCGECAALLDRLARVDANVDVPDPGPEYWERFNRRVMERVEDGEAAERAAAAPTKDPTPKRGWWRRRLPYFVPVAAAAALLLVVVRQTGMDPFHRTPPPRVSPTEASSPPAASRALPPASPPPSRDVLKETPAAGASRVRGSSPPPPPPSPAPSFAPPAGSLAAPASSAPSATNAAPKTAMEAMILRDMAGGQPAHQGAGEMERAGRGADGAPREPSDDRKMEMAGRALSKSPAAVAPAALPPPCEEARSLAGRGRLEEAESAQRSCLDRKIPPEAREGGMVFLAELLDRQSRLAEADSVIAETRRQFPASRTLDSYLRQRSGVQGRRLPATR